MGAEVPGGAEEIVTLGEVRVGNSTGPQRRSGLVKAGQLPGSLSLVSVCAVGQEWTIVCVWGVNKPGQQWAKSRSYKFSSQENKVVTVWWWMLATLIGIISQCVQMGNHYLVHLKLMLYVSYISTTTNKRGQQWESRPWV